MSEFAKEVLPINIEVEMKQAYMEYAMSVIVGRALPDVRDGLKPVHRRVLYAMSEQNNDWNKSYKKSARIVGDVMGKYHPHGDSAIYDTIVRMAQPFSLRYMLVDGQGNFGSVDGDAPAAMRYTEIRMARIAHQLLADIDKETVDFSPNYDGSEHEPVVFPSRIPNLLVNGSTGIAVGLATNIPPHNLSEVVNACVALIDTPELDVKDLLGHIPGPDFPTAGIVNGVSGVVSAYKTGRGKVYVRGRTHVEDRKAGARQSVIITELPYQVNKANMLERIADLVREKRVEGISGLRDESDKDGMRIVIELRRGEVPEVVINNLYRHTQLQTTFGINMVALINGEPKTLNLKQIIDAFISHRREVVTRRTIYDLKKARDRAHVLEGLAVALENIDEVIALIKSSANPAEAKEKLLVSQWRPGVVVTLLKKTDASVSRPEGLLAEFGLVGESYHLSDVQAQAILDLRLHRLTGLEKDKIINEYNEIIERIIALLEILNDYQRLMAVIRQELLDVKEQFGDERRTEIVQTQLDLSMEDLITEEDMVVTLSHEGYVKAQPVTTYQAQRRGGKGKSATSTKSEDFVEKLIIASTHDHILCFSTRGKVYWKKVYEIPQAGRTASGKPIVNLLPLEEGERITAMLPIREFDPEKFIFMASRSGTVKKTSLKEFSRPRPSGIIALDLHGDDSLVGVDITDGQQDILLFSNTGKCARFTEKDIRAMGRTARGVRGIRLAEGQSLISLIIASDGDILTVTENGFGKRTSLSEYPCKGRGGMGVISIQTSARNGEVIGAQLVSNDDEAMLISDAGKLVRIRMSEVSVLGRNTQGVRLFNVNENEHLVGIEKVETIDDTENTNNENKTEEEEK